MSIPADGNGGGYSSGSSGGDPLNDPLNGPSGGGGITYTNVISDGSGVGSPANDYPAGTLVQVASNGGTVVKQAAPKTGGSSGGSFGGGGGGGSGPISYSQQTDVDGSVTGVPGTIYQRSSSGAITIIYRPSDVSSPTGTPGDKNGDGIDDSTGYAVGVYKDSSSPSGYYYPEPDGTVVAVLPNGAPYNGPDLTGGGSSGGTGNLQTITRSDGSVYVLNHDGSTTQILGPDKSTSSSSPLSIRVSGASTSGGGSSSASDSAAISAAASQANTAANNAAEMARQVAQDAFTGTENQKNRDAQALAAAQQQAYDAAALNAQLQQKYQEDKVTENDAYLKALESTDPLSFAAFLGAGGGNISNALAGGNTALSQADLLAGARAKEALDQPFVPFTAPGAVAVEPGTTATGLPATGSTGATTGTGATGTTGQTPPATTPPVDNGTGKGTFVAPLSAGYSPDYMGNTPQGYNVDPYLGAGQDLVDLSRDQFLANNPGPHAAFTPAPGSAQAASPWEIGYQFAPTPTTPAAGTGSGLPQVPGQTQTAGVPTGGQSYQDMVDAFNRQARGGLRPAGNTMTIMGDTPSGRPDGHEEALMGDTVIPHPALVAMMGGNGGLRRALAEAPANGAPVRMAMGGLVRRYALGGSSAGTSGAGQIQLGGPTVAGNYDPGSAQTYSYNSTMGSGLSGGAAAGGYDLSGLNLAGLAQLYTPPAYTPPNQYGTAPGQANYVQPNNPVPTQAPAAAAAPASPAASAYTTPTVATGSTGVSGGSNSPAPATTPAPTTTTVPGVNATPPATQPATQQHIEQQTVPATSATIGTPTTASSGGTATATGLPATQNTATVPASGYGVSPITDPATLGITSADQPYMDAIQALRLGTQIPTVNPYDIGFANLAPTIQQLYFKGLTDKFGIPLQDSEAEQQRYALQGLRRQPVYGASNQAAY